METPEAAVIIVRSEMETRKCPFRVLMRIGGKRRSLFVFLEHAPLEGQQADA